MLSAEETLAARYERCHHSLQHDSAAAALHQFIDDTWRIRASATPPTGSTLRR